MWAFNSIKYATDYTATFYELSSVAMWSWPPSLPRHPNRRRPGDFAVDLQHADVVIVRAVLGLRVSPAGLEFGTLVFLWQERGDDFAVAQHLNFSQRRCAMDVKKQFRRPGHRCFVAHDRFAAAVIDENIVGGAVAVAFLDGVKQRLPFLRYIVALAGIDEHGEE